MKKIIFLFPVLLVLVGSGCVYDEDTLLNNDLYPKIFVSVSKESIDYRGSSVISWKSENSDYVLINNQKMGTEDSIVVKDLKSSTLYTITAFGDKNRTAFKDVMITVGKANAPTVKVTCPSCIPYGKETSFSWVASDATSVVLDGLFVADSGTFKTPILYESKEYTLVLEGPGGKLVQKIQINVLPQNKYTIFTTCGENGSVLPECNLMVKEGESATLTFRPKEGFEVESLKVDGVNVTPTSSLTLSNVTSNKNVEVSFKFKYAEGTPEWYFTQFVWVESKNESLIGGTWYNFTDDSTKKTYWYNTDGIYDYLFMGVTYKDTSLSWALDKTTDPITLVGGGKNLKKVEFLDSTKMVLSYANGNTTERFTYTNNGVRRFK